MLSTLMTDPLLEHPTEEALERFIMNKLQDDELEILETHILACEACVTRLEALEVEVASLKEALAAHETARIQEQLAPAKTSWRTWLTLPTLSWAGAAAAAIAVVLIAVPHSVPSSYDLTASRGSETVAILPENRPLDLRLDAGDLSQGPVNVQVVNELGTEVWRGQASVSNEKASVRVPELAKPGIYFVRCYAASDTGLRDLLREFRVQVK